MMWAILPAIPASRLPHIQPRTSSPLWMTANDREIFDSWAAPGLCLRVTLEQSETEKQSAQSPTAVMMLSSMVIACKVIAKRDYFQLIFLYLRAACSVSGRWL